MTGDTNIPLKIFKLLIGQGDAIDELILFQFRLPRMMIILARAALSISGAIVPRAKCHKNPIAEPGILGINAGGGFAITFIAIGKINASILLCCR